MSHMISPRTVSREEQIQLAARAQQGDEAATVTLLESCAGWVHKEAALAYRRLSTYQRPRIDQEDLAQEGFLGVLRALTKFDPSRGASFLTYAAWWIRQGIQRAIQADAEVAAHLWKVAGAVTAVLERWGLEPYEVDPRTVVKLEPRLRLRDVEGVWHALVGPISFDTELATDSDTVALADAIPDPAPERLGPIAPEVLVGLTIIEEHPRASTRLRRTLDLENDGWLDELYAWHQKRRKVRRTGLLAATSAAG